MFCRNHVNTFILSLELLMLRSRYSAGNITRGTNRDLKVLSHESNGQRVPQIEISPVQVLSSRVTSVKYNK